MAYQNFFSTRLGTDIGAADSTITLETVPTATSGRLVLEARNPSKREIISYTGVAGNTITGVTRGLGSTSATDHSKNALVEMNLTADDIQDILDAFESFSASNTDWRDLVGAITLSSTNGNRSFGISIVGDHSGYLSKGVRLRIPRTGTTPTQSADFNGTTQYASKAAPTGITFTDDFTLEAQVNTDTYNSDRNTIVARRNGTSGFHLRLNAAGQLAILCFGGGGSPNKSFTTVQSLQPGLKYHVAVRVDLSSTAATFVINGTEWANTSSVSGTLNSFTQAGELSIGAAYNGASYTDFYDGKLSDVRIWSTLRTTAEIKDNMNQQLTGSETGLVGYWKLNGNFNDSTANANNLTAAASVTATFADNPFNANAYAIIMSTPVHSGGNTTMTVQCPTGYSIPNQTLGTVSYSSMKAPYGFPTGEDLWTIISQNTVDQALSTATTNYQALNAPITAPIGEWIVQWSTTLTATIASTTARSIITGVSTSSSDVNIPGLSTYEGVDGESASAAAFYTNTFARGYYKAASATTLYLISAISSTASLSNFDTRAGVMYPTYIKLINSYL